MLNIFFALRVDYFNMQTFANSLALFNKTMVFTFQVGSEVCGGHGKWKCQTDAA